MRAFAIAFTLAGLCMFLLLACQPVMPVPPASLPEPLPQPTTLAAAPAVPTAGTTMTNPTDGAVYVHVPAGPFTMGAAADDAWASADQKPEGQVTTDAFWIMRTEVTNAQYQRCVGAGACQPPANHRWNDVAFAEHPVTNVTWQQANDYAAWAGGRLPTEAEWEKACRSDDGRLYPWGSDPLAAEKANYGGTVGDTMAVGSYPAGAGPYGALDMLGNVWEWTSSRDMPYPYQAEDGREDPQASGDRMLRGGAANIGTMKLRCILRFKFGPASGNELFGFRIVLPETAAAASASGATATDAGKSPVKVALVYGVQRDPFFAAMVRGAKAKAAELGVELSVDGPEYWDPTLQIPILEKTIAQQPAAICIAAVDPNDLVEPLQAASADGIHILSVDTYIGNNAGDYTSGSITFPLSYIASDNVEGGRIACQALIDAMGGKGKIYIQKVHDGITTLEQRAEGCREAILATNGAVELARVDVTEGDNQAARLLQGTFKDVPGVNGVFFTSWYTVDGALRGLDDAGQRAAVKIAAFDAGEESNTALRAGKIDLVIAQHPYEIGQKCVELAVAAANGDVAAVPKRAVTGYTVITQANVDSEEAQQAIYR